MLRIRITTCSHSHHLGRVSLMAKQEAVNSSKLRTQIWWDPQVKATSLIITSITLATAGKSL
jgi:hypothetical protein